MLLAFLGASQLAMAQRTILHCGKLIDGKSDQIRSQVSIIIEGNKIVAVESGYTRARNGEQVIDLKNRTVLPGLMDMHVHIEGENSPARQLQTYTLNQADVAYNA